MTKYDGLICFFFGAFSMFYFMKAYITKKKGIFKGL